MQDEKQDFNVPNDTVFQELITKIKEHDYISDESITLTLYLLSFSDYMGFSLLLK